MSLRRLLSVLSVVVAVTGLCALPTASVAKSMVYRQADDPSADDTSSADDSTDGTDDTSDVSDDVTDCIDDSTSADDGSGDDSSADDGSGDDGSTDDTGADTRQVDDSSDDTGDDTSSDDTGDGSTDDTSADDGTDVTDCFDDVGEGVGIDGITDSDIKDLGTSGGFDETFDMPGPGTIDESLGGGAGARAVIAKVRIPKKLGGAHVVVKKAGKVTVHIKLTKQGKRALRKAKRTVHLTLHTRIRLKTGKTVTRTKSITVKPKKAHKPKHKKH